MSGLILFTRFVCNEMMHCEGHRCVWQVDRLMNVLKRPFEAQPDAEAYTMPAPRNGVRVGVELLSCSS